MFNFLKKIKRSNKESEIKNSVKIMKSDKKFKSPLSSYGVIIKQNKFEKNCKNLQKFFSWKAGNLVEEEVLVSYKFSSGNIQFDFNNKEAFFLLDTYLKFLVPQKECGKKNLNLKQRYKHASKEATYFLQYNMSDIAAILKYLVAAYYYEYELDFINLKKSVDFDKLHAIRFHK